MNAKIVAIGLLILLAGLNARAVDVTGTCDSVFVQCDLQINNLDICNDQAFTQTFVPSVSGNVADWIKVLPESLTLEAGDCGKMEVYTIAPCYQEPGNYTASVTINGVNPQTLTCEITLNQGHFLDVEIIPQQVSVSQCETAEYEIILTNNTIVPNQQQEFVNLSIGGLEPSIVSLETFETIVTKGEEKSVMLSVTPACMQELGDYDFSVKASLFNPSFFSTAVGTLTIFQGQDFEIEIDETGFGTGTPESPFKACLEQSRTIPLTLNNTGEKNDNFEITLNAPSWVSLSTNNISIAQGEQTQVQLILSETDEPLSTYNAQITFTSTLYNFSQTIDFVIKLDDCFNAVLDFPIGQENLCKDEENNLEFTLTNDRENPIELNLEILGIDAQLDEQTVTLDPFEQRTITAQVNAENLAEEGSAQKKDVSVEVLFDASGSMNQRINEQRKIDIAKNAVLSFTKNITPIDLGLRVFGHTQECSESELIEPINENGIVNVEQKIKEFQAVGQTPLAQALFDASSDFENALGEKFVILVSDGKESCSGNVSQAAQELASKGIKVYAIGFDIDQTGKEQLQTIVNATGGTYFDAQDPTQLFSVFQEISKQLEIDLSEQNSVTFTVKATSENFNLEKDFTLNVSDCHNVAVFAPQLNVCRTVASTETVTITNIGTQTQELEIEVSPDFADIQTTNLTLEPGQTEFLELTINAKQSDTIQDLTINTSSENLSVLTQSTINYLDEQTCHGFDVIVLTPEFVGRIGEGERRKLLLVNLGRAPMNITLDGDQPWMYFEPEQVPLFEGETGFSNFYVTPPFDFDLLDEDAVATITATNEFGITLTRQTTLVVTGPTFGLVPENVEITQIQTTTLPEEDFDKDIQIVFTLKNQNDRTVEIRSITIPGYNVSSQVENTVLKSNESTQVTLLVDTGEKTGAINLPIVVTTTDGSFLQEIQLELKEPGIVEEPEQPQDGLTGFFTLSNLTGLAVVVLIIIGLLIIVYIVTKPKDEQKKAEETQTEVFKETKEKIVEEKTVQKKPARKLAKKKTVKKKASKKK